MPPAFFISLRMCGGFSFLLTFTPIFSRIGMESPGMGRCGGRGKAREKVIWFVPSGTKKKLSFFFLMGYSEAPLLGYSNCNSSLLATSDRPSPLIPVVLTTECLLALTTHSLGQGLFYPAPDQYSYNCLPCSSRGSHTFVLLSGAKRWVTSQLLPMLI